MLRYGDAALDPWLVGNWWFVPADSLESGELDGVIEQLAKGRMDWVVFIVR